MVSSMAKGEADLIATSLTLTSVRPLASQLEKHKRISNDESKEGGFLLGKYRNLEHEVDLVREIQVDRRANYLNNELEEHKSSLEWADRLRRNAEQGFRDGSSSS